MKNSAAYERKFRLLLARLRKAYPVTVPQGLPSDPTVELIWSALLEDSSEGSAKVGVSRLSNHFVDYNEIRVSRPEEIVETLPNTIGDGKARGSRIIRALQSMFDKFDTLTITELRDQPKREARGFLASVPEMTPFVEGRVCLFALGVHAMPVDATLVKLLAERGAVHPDTDPRDTQGFLERVVPAKDALETALVLEAFRQAPDKIPADRPRPARGPKPAAKPAARPVKQAKKKK